MNLNQLKKLYTNSPLWIQKLYASIPYEIRNGAEYRKWQSFLQEEIDEEAYQFLKLRETLAYAKENIPYYQKTFSEIDFNIEDFKNLKEITLLPLIDKDTVRNNYELMINKNYPKKNFFYVTTGGSSGEPMKFLQSKNVWAKELAFVNNYFKENGYTTQDLKASFRGGDFENIKNNEYWKLNPIHNEIHFSPFHIGRESITHYVSKLNQLQPKFIHTYPSAIMAIMRNMHENSLSLNYQIKCIFLISENITKEEILEIKSYFNCNVSSFFGHTERLIFAPLEQSTLQTYRINKRYGFVELIDSNRQKKELVGTSFDNFAMPLIRYRTDDYSSYENEEEGLIHLIDGRWDKEYLNGKNGLSLTLTALNMHSDIFKNVLNFQFYQDKIGEATILIIPSKNYTEQDGKKILNALEKKGGHALSFKLKLVSAPLLTKRGKLKKLIKEI